VTTKAMSFISHEPRKQGSSAKTHAFGSKSIHFILIFFATA